MHENTSIDAGLALTVVLSLGCLGIGYLAAVDYVRSRRRRGLPPFPPAFSRAVEFIAVALMVIFLLSIILVLTTPLTR